MSAWVRSRAAAALLLFALPQACRAAPAAPLAPDQDATVNRWIRVVQSRLIRSAMRSHDYPRPARVVVAFFVERDGGISAVRIVSSSDPDPRFARLATRVVALAGPFPPIPAGYKGARAPFIVPLAFRFTPPGRHHPRR